MALREKRSPKPETIPIQDYANELVPPLPESIRKFPGMAAWQKKVQGNFDTLLKNLWRKEAEKERD